MAFVTIPMGGQSVQIEVPDFAMETTQQDILAAIRGSDQPVVAAVKQSSQQNTQQQQSITQALFGIKADLNEDKAYRQRADAAGALRSQTTGAAQALLTKETFSLSEIVSGVGNSIGNFGSMLGGLSGGLAKFAGFMVGAGGGLFIGVMEKMSAGMQKLGRIGVGTGESLNNMSLVAAKTGMSFDQLGAVTLAGARGLRTLADNTGDALMRFGDLSRSFQQGVASVGSFGMNIGDLNTLMLEELDARRVTMGYENLSRINMTQFTESVKENILQQEALARVTGQDAQARLAAQKEVRQNAIAQSFLRGQTDETRQRLERMASSLSQMGPLGSTVSNAIINSLATGMDPSAFAGETLALMSPAGRALVDQLQNSVMAGDPEQIAFYQTQLATELANMSDTFAGGNQSLAIMALKGGGAIADAAGSFLQAKTTTEGLTVSLDGYTKAFGLAVDGVGVQLRGMATDMSRAANSIVSLVRQSVLAATSVLTGGTPDEAGGNPAAGLQNLLNGLSNLNIQMAEAVQQSGQSSANQIVAAINNLSNSILNNQQATVPNTVDQNAPGG